MVLFGVVCLPGLFFASKAFPLCASWAVHINVATAAILIALGAMPSFIIMYATGDEQLRPYYAEAAQGAAISTTVVFALGVIVSLVMCILSCKKMVQHHGTGRKPLVSMERENDFG